MNKRLKQTFGVGALAGLTLLSPSCDPDKEKEFDPEAGLSRKEMKARLQDKAVEITNKDTTTYTGLSKIYAEILYKGMFDAVTDPDMAATGIKTVQIMLDSLQSKYGTHIDIPAQYAIGPRPEEYSDPLTITRIRKARGLFNKVPDLARRTGIARSELTDLATYAIKKAVKDLDPHGGYYPPKKFKSIMQESEKFGGFGFTYAKDIDNGYFRIQPFDGSPADKYGLQSYDLITHINGTDVKNLDSKGFSALARGKEGESAIFTIMRGENTVNITVERGKVVSPNVTSRLIDGDTGYIKLDEFNKGSTRDIKDAVKSLQTQTSKEITGYILDLRGNPGGYVSEAMGVSDLFLNDGYTYSEIDKYGYWDMKKAKPGDIIDGKPLAVLIDGGSASASEIVSGNLADKKRATIIGLTSYGKGTAQIYYSLNRGHGFAITTAFYATAAGTSIQGKGVVPDIKVAPADTAKISKESDYANMLVPPEKVQMSTRKTTNIATYKAPVNRQAISQEEKQLSGKLDAHISTAIDWLNSVTGDKKPQHTIRTPAP